MRRKYYQHQPINNSVKENFAETLIKLAHAVTEERHNTPKFWRAFERMSSAIDNYREYELETVEVRYSFIFPSED